MPFVIAGQVSDYIAARALLSSLPKVDWLLEITAMTPIGSEKPCKTSAFGHAFRVESPALKLYDTTSADIKGATAPLVTLLRNALPGQ